MSIEKVSDIGVMASLAFLSESSSAPAMMVVSSWVNSPPFPACSQSSPCRSYQATESKSFATAWLGWFHIADDSKKIGKSKLLRKHVHHASWYDFDWFVILCMFHRPRNHTSFPCKVTSVFSSALRKRAMRPFPSKQSNNWETDKIWI